MVEADIAVVVRKWLKYQDHITGADPGGSGADSGTGLVTTCSGRVLYALTLPYAELIQQSRGVYHSTWENHVLVMEEFLLYPHTVGRLQFNKVEPARAIGVLELWAANCGVEVVFQTASVAKESVTNTLIQQVFPETPKTISRHERDALRHVVCYAMSRACSQ